MDREALITRLKKYWLPVLSHQLSFHIIYYLLAIQNANSISGG